MDERYVDGWAKSRKTMGAVFAQGPRGQLVSFKIVLLIW